jgi:hypothetical protein
MFYKNKAIKGSVEKVCKVIKIKQTLKCKCYIYKYICTL